MTLLLIVQSAINTHEFYSRCIVTGFQCRPDATKGLRSAPRNFKCGADRLRHVRLVGHLMLLPESPLALTLRTASLKTDHAAITKSTCDLMRNTSSCASNWRSSVGILAASLITLPSRLSAFDLYHHTDLLQTIDKFAQ